MSLVGKVLQTPIKEDDLITEELFKYWSVFDIQAINDTTNIMKCTPNSNSSLNLGISYFIGALLYATNCIFSRGWGTFQKCCHGLALSAQLYFWLELSNKVHTKWTSTSKNTGINKGQNWKYLFLV